MGGLKIAHRAWQDLHEAQYASSPAKSEERLFFVSYAQNWSN
jgi:hypothetical protein